MPDVRIKSLGGKEFGGYCAMPTDGKPAPGLVVLQEIFGVNPTMRQICDDFAAQGYIAVCPDLFWRQQPDVQLTDQTPEGWDQAMKLLNGFDAEDGVRDILSTIAYLRGLKNCSGKVGAVGYCLGGKMAYLTASRCDVDATVSYYGIGLEDLLGEIHDIRMPFMLHMAEQDEYVPDAARQKILKGLARNPGVLPYVYDGVGHAFARVGGKHYNAEAAKLANERTFHFFAQTLQN